jgi:hypothetical protein
MSAMNLTQQIIAAKKMIQEAAQNASAEIQSGSDNPKIQRVRSSSIRAFTLSSKNLGDNWSPFFHDWKAQYNSISDMLEKQQFGALRELIETGHCIGKGHNRVSYAPEVVERTKSIVGDLLINVNVDAQEELAPEGAKKTARAKP